MFAGECVIAYNCFSGGSDCQPLYSSYHMPWTRSNQMFTWVAINHSLFIMCQLHQHWCLQRANFRSLSARILQGYFVGFTLPQLAQIDLSCVDVPLNTKQTKPLLTLKKTIWGLKLIVILWQWNIVINIITVTSQYSLSYDICLSTMLLLRCFNSN